MFGAITLKLVVDALSDLPIAVGVARLQTVKNKDVNQEERSKGSNAEQVGVF